MGAVSPHLPGPELVFPGVFNLTSSLNTVHWSTNTQTPTVKTQEAQKNTFHEFSGLKTCGPPRRFHFTSLSPASSSALEQLNRSVTPWGFSLCSSAAAGMWAV